MHRTKPPKPPSPSLTIYRERNIHWVNISSERNNSEPNKTQNKTKRNPVFLQPQKHGHSLAWWLQVSNFSRNHVRPGYSLFGSHLWPLLNSTVARLRPPYLSNYQTPLAWAPLSYPQPRLEKPDFQLHHPKITTRPQPVSEPEPGPIEEIPNPASNLHSRVPIFDAGVEASLPESTH
jgi:hypothetical protein